MSESQTQAWNESADSADVTSTSKKSYAGMTSAASNRSSQVIAGMGVDVPGCRWKNTDHISQWRTL